MRWPLLERRHMKTKKLLRHSLFFLLLFAGGSTVLAQDTAEESTVWEQDCAKESTVNPGVGGFITSLPLDPSYAEECKEQGTVETLTYTCHSYALEAVTGESNIMLEKSVNVYLPYGYDENQEYDILYLLHGTGGFEDYWIGDSSTGKVTCNMLDNMIEAGECEPVIVVSPTYYSPTEEMGYRKMDPMELFNNEKDPYADQWPMYFWKELRNDIIPLIESTYSTYAEKDVSEAKLQKTRDHRGFAGLSRGSKTTVNSGMMHCADLFAYIGSYSGAWADVEAFKEILESEEYRNCDFKYWYNGNGTEDFSLENHEEFLNEVLEKMPDRFSLDKNVAWVVFDGGGHAYNCWIADLYNSLLVFFKK